MEASLTCAVCLSLFEEPVTLPVCSHNFCRPCVVECLSQTRSAAAAEPSSSRPAPRPFNQPLELRQTPGRASRNGSALAVSCPLCRKLCPLPQDGGAAALPINTTLAEVVKLFKAANAGKPSRELTAEEASATLVPRLAALGSSCEKHPDRSLQLYCRMCRRGGCGQCVSEEHRGIFHAVNLIDVVYQEEKLAFFSNLKKLRELHLQLMKEAEIYSKDVEAVMQNEEEAIKTEFEKVFKALEARKKQLLEDLENQKKRKIKECLIWKRMKDVHRQTVENILSDCEKLLEECDPSRFLEVACNLNQRMKTQLDLMQIASSNKNQVEYKQREMDTTSVINDILALHLSAVNLGAIKGSPFGDSELEDKKSLQEMFFPMTGEGTLDNNNIPIRYMSVSAATELGSMSHEELRYNYYMKHQMCSGGLQKRTSSLKGRYIVQPKFQYLKSMTSAVAPSLLSKTENQEKVKKQTSFPNSFAFTFKGQSVRFNVPCSRNNSNCSVKECSSLEKRHSFSKATEVSPVHEVMLSSDTQLSSALFSDSSQSATPSKGASNLPSSTPVLEHLAPPNMSSSNATIPTANKESNPSFRKDNLDSSDLFLEKSKDSNIRSNIIGYNSSNSSAISPSNISAAAATTTTTITISNSGLDSAVFEKPAFSAFSPSSHNSSLQTAKVNSSGQNFYPFFLPVQKTGQESITISFGEEDNLACDWLVSSALAPCKPVVGKSGFINTLVCQTSSSASDTIDSSKKQPENLSSDTSSSTPHVFAFTGTVKNRCNTQNSSSRPSVKIEKAKMKLEDNAVVNMSVPCKGAPSFQEFEDVMSHSSSSRGKCRKSTSDSSLGGQQNKACGIDAMSTLASNPTEQDRRSFRVLPDGAHCTPTSDSDTDDLSQASSSSDCSSTSVFFCY